jgi:hypothetical protein
VPYTFFAHQVPVLPVKLARPRAVDGTALCIGSMAPDLAYPLGEWLSRQSHTAIGVVVWALPTSFAICAVVRRWVAPVAFAHLPDARWLRVHSYRVLGARRPPRWQTVLGAVFGATTHVVIDGFTHDTRFGARWLGLGDVDVTLPVRGETSSADALQLAGHTFGSLAAVALLLYIGRRGLLERWYGAEVVAGARHFVLERRQRVVFWGVVALGVPLGLAWTAATTGVKAFRLIDSVALTTAVACLLPACRPRPAGAGRGAGGEPVSRT